MTKNHKIPTTLWGYARVSTEDQDVALQCQALLKYGVPAENIIEEHKSGGTMDRPQWNSLMKSARKGDTIVVWRLDRLGRTLIGVIDTVGTLHEKGIQLISLQDSFDTTTAMGEALFHVALVFAQLERRLISERTKAGIAAKRAYGAAHGRPHLIKDFPKRIQAMRSYVETYGQTALNEMHYSEALERLNKADRKAPQIKSAETYKRWRRDKFEGL